MTAQGEYVIGIDIGTTSTVGILIGLPDRVLAQTTRPVTLFSKKPGWAEEDAEQWWQNTCEIIPELITQAGVSANSILAVGVTGMLPALVLLDENHKLLRLSIQQSDARSGNEVRELAQEIDEQTFLQQAGNGINQQLIATKLRWLEKHEPDIFSRIATVFGSYDYINWKLTGVRAVEQNWALEAGFVDLHNGQLSESLIKLAHISPSVIPKLSRSHEILGSFNAEASAATGLPVGVPVVGGAADHIASSYAAGITDPGDILLKFGGSADVMIATDKAVPDARMFLDYHLIPGLYMPNGCMASGGSALNWLIDKFASGERQAATDAGLTLHQHLDRLATPIPAGADGVQIVPYFLGEKTPIHDPAARGIIHGLSLNHDLRHLWRAMLEGFAYAFRHHVEVFNDMGFPTRRFLASDGGASSRLWMQICADVLQQPIRLLDGHPGSCLGAAWMAVIGSGLSDDWGGVSNYVSYGDLVEPVSTNSAVYDQGYKQFRQSYQMLATLGDSAR